MDELAKLRGELRATQAALALVISLVTSRSDEDTIIEMFELEMSLMLRAMRVNAETVGSEIGYRSIVELIQRRRSRNAADEKTEMGDLAKARYFDLDSGRRVNLLCSP